MYSQNYETLLQTNIYFDEYILVRMFKVKQSATNTLSEIPIPEIFKSLASFSLPCSKMRASKK